MPQKLTLQRLGELTSGLPDETPITFHGYDKGCGIHAYVDSDVWLFPKAGTPKTHIVLNPGPTYDSRAGHKADSVGREVCGIFVVCEVICQEPSVSVHLTAASALKHAIACALENLTADDWTAEDKLTSQADFETTLTEHDCIREGDYEVHILTPTS